MIMITIIMIITLMLIIIIIKVLCQRVKLANHLHAHDKLAKI